MERFGARGVQCYLFIRGSGLSYQEWCNQMTGTDTEVNGTAAGNVIHPFGTQTDRNTYILMYIVDAPNLYLCIFAFMCREISVDGCVFSNMYYCNDYAGMA